MYRFTMPSEKWDEDNPDKLAILTLIRKHRSLSYRLHKNKQYYEGEHEILMEDRKNKLVCNHAKDIADTASSYFIGNAVSYKANHDITILTEALDAAGADGVDGDNGLDLSVYGLAYEYIYAKQNETELTIRNLSPENTFMVYDDTVEENELFAVYYYQRTDDTDKTSPIYVATVLTRNWKYVLNIQDVNGPQALIEVPVRHYMEEVPVVEYQNNKLAIGDYELQIPLIDAYNALMSDRITDKEQFIDAILAVYGSILSDPDAVDENGRTVKETVKEDKLIELPKDSRAEYLIRTFDESGVEILKRAIEQDIHKFSNIPCMTDEAFGGNVSGVAMEFKLLGMENITKIKTRYYKKGLKKRLRIFARWLYISRNVTVDIVGITPTFTRALPKNLLEISQYVANLWGKVSKKTLLSQIPFVEDVDAELEALEKETEEAVKQQQEIFGIGTNLPLEDKPEEDSGDIDE